ncbi:MAG: mannose-1-phosphate guanylyltransferase/mannose-6-phosphate isomerase [Pseudomonadota bacterium]
MSACLPPLLPVILAGGAGTRLWPVSRETMPKHLANLVGDESLLQMTAKRVTAIADADKLITVAAQHQDLLIKRQLNSIDPKLARHRLLEPIGRNTAAAIALAALYARRTFGDDAVLWVCPSDHLMRNQPALTKAVAQALPAAAEGDLLTFGIQPTRPETGYGYIKSAAPADNSAEDRVSRVERFVEKPDFETAERMVAAGGYLWNSGMFLFRADRIIEELATHEPNILSATEAAFEASTAIDDGSLHPPRALYESIPSQPIDKAVMERATRIAVVPCDPDWTDLGSWHAIWEMSEKDEDGNAARGDVLLSKTSNCLVQANGRLVACAGIHDLAVIETEDAVLVVDRTSSEPVKQIVGTLNEAERSEAQAHRDLDRTWGRVILLDDMEKHEVRRLEIFANQAIEAIKGVDVDLHWFILSGTAVLTRNGERMILETGTSADLDAGTAYRLGNDGPSMLRLVQISKRP